MKSLVEQWGNIWERISKSPTQLPSRVVIHRDHVDEGEKLGTAAIQPPEHYFQVRINEMYLTYSRQWFSKYDPMVFVVSEFIYNKKTETVPYIVGPMMIEKYGKKIPAGMVFSDTRVAGLHPYHGGGLTLSMVLCRVKREDYARKFMQIVENSASVLDFSTALSTYVKVASVVLDGVESMLDLDDIQPLIGLRKQFGQDASDVLESQYFALIDMPESELNTKELWVRERQLVYGKSLEDAKPFRDADYVLFSIISTQDRSDETILPFYPLWERIVQEATMPDENSWKRAKADMVNFYQTLVLSPDLTPNQADKLNDKYVNEMIQLHEKAVDMSTLGPGEEKEISEVDSKLRQATKILDL